MGFPAPTVIKLVYFPLAVYMSDRQKKYVAIELANDGLTLSIDRIFRRDHFTDDSSTD